MTLKKALLAVTAVSLLWLAACGDTDETPGASTSTSASSDTTDSTHDGAAAQTFTKDDNGSEGRLEVGEEVVVSLETCGGCGYEWQITQNTNPAVAESLGSTNQPRPTSTQPGDPPIVGAPTDELFRFRGMSEGTTEITIGYFPPAENAPEETFTITFVLA